MRKKKMNPRNLIISIALFAVFLIFLGGVMAWEYLSPDAAEQTTPQTRPTVAPTESAETVPTSIPVETTLPEFETRRINFLLVGRDWHGEGENGRSDTMILCSVDTGTKTVKMVSFLRDIYLKIPGHGSSRLNAAYSWGGAELLKETLKENFDVDVDVTLEIDFEGFKGLIDTLGSVDVVLTESEAKYLNNHYGWELTGGMTHMDGEIALGYSRIRYLDSDFVRTERQRNVLTALLEKYRSASFATMLTVTDAFLDESTSDHTDEELLAYALELYSTLSEAELTTHRVPADGTYTYETIRGMSVIEVDFEANRELLEDLLGDEQAQS